MISAFVFIKQIIPAVLGLIPIQPENFTSPDNNFLWIFVSDSERK